MKLGIMQPYFFPYLGYFDLINYSDRWIVFDSVQYIRHGWINRNRILHPLEGWSYIIVPVKASREITIRDVQIVNDGKWKKRIMGQLLHYKKRAPYYDNIIELLKKIFSHETSFISDLNVFALKQICSYLDIQFNYTIFSNMNLEIDDIQEPGDWALRISQALGAQEYVNPIGGEQLFDKKKFASSQIKLTIRKLPPIIYECPGYEYIPGLSIIDVLMWNRPEEIKKYLDNPQNKG